MELGDEKDRVLCRCLEKESKSDPCDYSPERRHSLVLCQGILIGRVRMNTLTVRDQPFFPIVLGSLPLSFLIGRF